jgi:exonuclease VII small subunit
MTTNVTIKGPDEPAPARFAEAYAELQAIAARLKPAQGQIPDVDAIEPLIRRANVLAKHCQERIEAVRKLIGEQTTSA